MNREPIDAQDGDFRARLRALIARELRVEPAQIEDERNLTLYGLDSLSALVVAGDIEEMAGVTLEETALWDNPSIAAIAKHVGTLRSTQAAAQLDLSPNGRLATDYSWGI